MKVTDLTLFAPRCNFYLHSLFDLKGVNTCNSRRKPVDYGA